MTQPQIPMEIPKLAPEEPANWSLCCSKSSPEAIKYVVHVAVAIMVISFSMSMIITLPPEEDKTVYWSSLSATIGWVMPSPSISTPPQPQQRRMSEP